MINIPIWLLVILLLVPVWTVVMQALLIRHNEKVRAERELLNINIAKLMTSEVETQREKKAGHHKWTNIKYMEIRSPVIKRDADCRGYDTTMFANGVLIARERGAGADAKMDS